MVLTGETEVLGENPYTVWMLDRWMNKCGAMVE